MTKVNLWSRLKSDMTANDSAVEWRAGGALAARGGKPAKKNPIYRTDLYDGENVYYHSQTGKGARPDMIGIDPDPCEENIRCLINTRGEGLQGRMSGDDLYINAIFRGAKITVTVREKPERVGDSDCYVIEARTNRGKYILWMDPNHGYNIARAEVSRSGNDILGKKPLAESKTPYGQYVSDKYSFRDVRFKKIGDIWVPMEATMKSIDIYSDGKKSDKCITTIQYKRTEVIVNPDHDALGSFVPKFPNGSTVRVLGVPRVRFTWKDGKYTDPQSMGEQSGKNSGSDKGSVKQAP
jgi:hypothetical protein